MSFAIDCGSDLYGNKVNVELRFNHHPSLPELAAATETAFDTKARATRPAGYPDQPFKIETFQVFDDTLLRWVDLYDAKQLRSGSQLWCFQPESIWHSDAQGVIPEPEKNVVTLTTPLGSPRRGRIAADAGVPPTLSEKLRSVFYQIDGSNKKYLLHEDLVRAFQACDMDFTHATAGDLFTLADSNRSNHITYDEWVNFAIKAPSIVDALFFRMRDMYQDRAPQGFVPNHDAQHQRQQELQQMYNQQWAQDQRARQEAEFQAAKARQEADARARQEADRARMEADHRARQEAEARARQEAERARMEAEQRARQEAEARARQEAEARARQEAEFAAARERQARQAREREDAARAAEAQAREAQARAEQLARQAAEADQQAAAAQQQLSAAREAARQADAAHAASQAQAAASAAQQAEAERAASQRAYSSSPPPPSMGYGQPQQASMQGSPQRDNALRDYEAARRKADEIRMMKEEAEREERNAWDRCYYAPSSPHYGPGSRGY